MTDLYALVHLHRTLTCSHSHTHTNIYRRYTLQAVTGECFYYFRLNAACRGALTFSYLIKFFIFLYLLAAGENGLQNGRARQRVRPGKRRSSLSNNHQSANRSDIWAWFSMLNFISKLLFFLCVFFYEKKRKIITILEWAAMLFVT